MGLCLINFCVGQPLGGPRKIFHIKRGPQPKMFGNRCLTPTQAVDAVA